MLILQSNIIRAEIDPVKIELHSISNDDALAVVSWPNQAMIALSVEDQIESRFTVISITSDRVILKDTINGDSYLLGFSDLTLVTATEYGTRTNLAEWAAKTIITITITRTTTTRTSNNKNKRRLTEVISISCRR